MIYRLKKQSDFDKLFKKGKRAYSRSLMMLYTKSNQLKIGYSLGKKHGKAVKRNRIKRLLRSAAREVFKNLNISYNVVFLPKVQEEYSFKEYVHDMAYLIKKENLNENIK